MNRSAAIVTVGSELTLGLRVDTNTAEIASSLAHHGFKVHAAISLPDDLALLEDELRALTSQHHLVVVTGGLGPTHDDITREAASRALGRPLVVDPASVSRLEPWADRCTDESMSHAVKSQAEVLLGSEVIAPTTGTAPGQIVETPAGVLVLLPGPPFEMRPMLAHALERFPSQHPDPIEIGVVQMSESEAQALVETALAETTGIGFTILACPGDVRVILTDEGAGHAALMSVADGAIAALGANCYANDASTLAEVLVRESSLRGISLAAAESCTGGLVSASITEIPGSSAVFLGGVTSYSNESKIRLIRVRSDTLEAFGAVSGETAAEMARGIREELGADIAVSVTGIAGPSGGTAEKPVGTVWFGIDRRGEPPFQILRRFAGGHRGSVRARATSTALDLLRRAVIGLPLE